MPFAALTDRWFLVRVIDARRNRPVFLIDIAVPAILAKGYDGIFMDTLDNAEAMERQNPIENKGMVAAGAALVA